MVVRVQEGVFDAGHELTRFSQMASGIGAVVTFSGLVRDVSDDLKHMIIEHYPAMTVTAIEAIEKEAVNRWDLKNTLIIHRYGLLGPGDQIMMVATAARHRRAAFEAAEYLMDYLKSRAPFWKKEVNASGESWVGSEQDDEDALKRW